MATQQRSNEEGIACSILERHHSSLSQSMTSPYTVVNICQILYSKRCVDEPTLDDVESGGISLEDKKKLLLAKVHLRLSDDHRKLHELATVLDLFKETKSVAKNILNDYILDVEQKEMPAKSAKEAILKNTSRVIDAVTGCSFQGFVTGCAEKSLITPYYRNHLLHDTPMNKEALLIGEIEKVVHFQPSCLDTVLCILIDKCGIPGTVVAEAVANDYGHMLPNYEKTKPTFGTATSVVSCDDNVEEMVCSEDRASDILRSHYSTLSQSLKDPVNIARLLHGENVISEDAVTQVNSAAIKDRTTVLLGSIRKAIHDNHQHLQVFGRVLQQLTAGIERVGQDISNDYDKVFPTTSIFSMTSTPSTTTVQSTTGAEPTATDVHHRITLDMEKKFSHIRIKFGKLFREVKQTLINHNVPVDHIKSFCKLTYPKCSQDVNDRQTMEDVLAFVGKKCTLIDVSVLEELIDDCEIDEAKQHIQHYQQAIDDFSQNMRTRFPLNQSLLPDGTPHPLRGETITFVTDWNKETVSLDDIKDLLKYAFESHSMHVKVIVINETNSIMITCLFPFELTGLLMAVAMKNLRLLKKNGLLKLTIGYCTIWNIRDEEETDKLSEVIKEEMNVETVGDTSDIITDQQRDTESELVGQTDKTIEELQQLLQGNEDQTFQSQTTTPPSSSDTPSDKQMFKQQIKVMIMEIETLKSQLESKQKLEQIQQQLEDKDREIELLQEKISSQNIQLLDCQQHEREKYIKQITSDIKELHSQNEKIKSLKGISDKVVSSIYSSLVNEVPPPDPNDTERERRVKWDMSSSDSVVTLTSPTPSDCITLIRQISIDRRPCEEIRLYSSSTSSTIILLSQLHQTNTKRLMIFDTKLTIEVLSCVGQIININQLEFLELVNTFLSTSGGLHLLTDAISTNTSLGELWLWHDRLTEDDMVNISQTLTINTTLQRLYLRNCNIADDGLVHLSNGLTRNKTLEVLDISFNDLISSTTAVCDIIHNSSLTDLYLYNTSLPSDSIPQLLDALSTNNTIRRLEIDERHREKCEQHKNYQHIQDRIGFI